MRCGESTSENITFSVMSEIKILHQKTPSVCHPGKQTERSSFKKIDRKTWRCVSTQYTLKTYAIFASFFLFQKLLSDSQKDSITKDFNGLNLTKYIGEVVSGCNSLLELGGWGVEKEHFMIFISAPVKKG